MVLSVGKSFGQRGTLGMQVQHHESFPYVRSEIFTSKYAASLLRGSNVIGFAEFSALLDEMEALKTAIVQKTRRLMNKWQLLNSKETC
jgi:hypothetical protein